MNPLALATPQACFSYLDLHILFSLLTLYVLLPQDVSLALFPAEVLNDLYVTLDNVRDLMSLLAIATQVLVVVAVLMALLVGFLARRRQFAVLRAIGASRTTFFVSFGSKWSG